MNHITCAKATNIAGTNSAGERLPSGWHCAAPTSSLRIVCRRQSVSLSYTFQGEAG